MSDAEELIQNKQYLKLFNEVVKLPPHMPVREFIKQRLERLNFVELVQHPSFFGATPALLAMDFDNQANEAGISKAERSAAIQRWESFMKDARALAFTQNDEGIKPQPSALLEELHEMLKKQQDESPMLRAQRVRPIISGLIEQLEGPGRVL